ncbi:MAG: tRNA (N6-isopentenyl adenosine(37)-C2)-methylthiotransferase MiaB [Bdellovibrionota bacterium]
MKGLYIQTFGCQMNVSDSDRMKAVLAPLNYENVTDPSKADLILINTCSIREKAEGKMSSFAYDLQELKRNNPKLILGITGCVAQQEKEKIIEKLPFVDIVLGPDNIDELPWALDEIETHPEKHITRTHFDDASRVWKTKTLINNPGISTFVNVMKGCDHFCSYCIVPWTRGRERSRPIADVVEDVKDLCSKGVREVTFLGQNINSYGKRAGESLEELFYKVHEIPDLKRIRFTTSHPGDLKPGLIQCFKDLPKLSSNFHLPVQSASNRILRSMRRFYTREAYLEKAYALLEARPDISFSTDIIVGFPSETEEEFQMTLKLVEELRYDNVYSFAYSPRPGTSASERSDQVDDVTKLRRLMELQTIARRISRERHMAEIGQVSEILIEGTSKKDPNRWTGRNSQNVPVHVDKAYGHLPGDLVKLKIIDASLTHLIGQPVALSH